jgi:hypothetical protein
MTIAIVLKVHDGMVLAPDSASTMVAVDDKGNPAGISIVYNNANKVYNLCKGVPLGAVTWGLGSIGASSTATLMKDFRARLCGLNEDGSDWRLDRNTYTVGEVAGWLFEFIYRECYIPAFVEAGKPTQAMGFAVAGYSAKQGSPEVYHVEIESDGSCTGPQLYSDKDEPATITWHGQPTAIFRLLHGYDDRLPSVLQTSLGIPDDVMPQVVEILEARLGVPLVVPAMPIQDAIDLASFLANVSAQFSHFAQGPDTVGGPIEIAAITKHEGFKWIRRKHYYNRELNPEVTI